jgi:hypothetical protein
VVLSVHVAQVEIELTASSLDPDAGADERRG